MLVQVEYEIIGREKNGRSKFIWNGDKHRLQRFVCQWCFNRGYKPHVYFVVHPSVYNFGSAILPVLSPPLQAL